MKKSPNRFSKPFDADLLSRKFLTQFVTAAGPMPPIGTYRTWQIPQGHGTSEVADAWQTVEKWGQAPHTMSHSSGFLLLVRASPRFSTDCQAFLSEIF